MQNNDFGLMEIVGYYTEEAEDVEETSFLVYSVENDFHKLETLVTFLGKKYHQDSVLFISPDKKIYLTDYIWSKNGDRCIDIYKTNLGIIQFHTTDTDKIFSQLGSKLIGRTFKVTETVDCYVPISSYLRRLSQKSAKSLA